MSNLIANEFTIGDRVELKPHLDLWMRGARWGEVTKILLPREGSKHNGRIYVRLDATETVHNFAPTDLVII